MVTLLASFPSPPTDRLTIGPLTFRFYGLMIALGVMAAVEIGRRRWEAKGGDPDDIVKIATWAVPAGLVGARLYHVATDWKMYRGRWLHVPMIWEGGLGIPGGLILGVIVGVIVARRLGIDIRLALDAVIPGIPVAQAIGRLGNWFNQEIFGWPTDVPWAVEIAPEYRPARFVDSATFHPAFLYEGLWNIALALLLIRLDRSKKLKPGQILPLWIAGYGLGRFVVEGMRTDAASLIWGVRVNHWVSGIALVVGLVAFVWVGKTSVDGDVDPGDIESEVGEVLDGAVVAPVEVVGAGDGGGSLGGRGGEDVGETAADIGDDHVGSGERASPANDD